MVKQPRPVRAKARIRETIARRAVANREKLTRDYAAGRRDAQQILKDLEGAQLELLDHEDA
jgi:hypothetical protein